MRIFSCFGDMITLWIETAQMFTLNRFFLSIDLNVFDDRWKILLLFISSHVISN